jgi:hypothetical protein
VKKFFAVLGCFGLVCTLSIGLAGCTNTKTPPKKDDAVKKDTPAADAKKDTPAADAPKKDTPAADKKDEPKKDEKK